MDIVTLISLIFSFFALVLAFVLEGGLVQALLQPTAALIVFGGTIGVIGISFPGKSLVKLPKLIVKAFSKSKINRKELMDYLLDIAGIARREGLLALESEILNNKFDDDFIVTGLKMVIDGADAEILRSTLENKITNIQDRHAKGYAIFEAAGGYAPTMGVIGTVMGLVNVLADLSNPDELGKKIAVAFIATLYGVGSANLIWLPIATKLKELDNEEITTKYMLLDGITMMQSGSNPAVIKENLRGYLENEKEEEKG